MSSNRSNLHEIRVCTNSRCGFRFPVSPTEKRITDCPICGSQTLLAEEPYESFRIREKETSRRAAPFVAVLDNIRSTFNVGAMFRTGDGVGIGKLYLCGITPTPENPKVGKTALGAESVIPWEHSWDILNVLQILKEEGYTLWALEGGTTAVNIFTALPEIAETDPLALIVGNEISGVDPAAIQLCDRSVFIPMEGMKESLNVAIAFGVAAYVMRYGGNLHG